MAKEIFLMLPAISFTAICPEITLFLISFSLLLTKVSWLLVCVVADGFSF